MIGSLEGVEALVPVVGTLDGTSTPTDDQVETWLNEATVMVSGALALAGYSTTVAVDSAIYPLLAGMTQLYAGAYVLRAMGIDVASGAEEQRSEAWIKDFYARLKWLLGGHLEVLGLTLSVTTPSRRIRTRQVRRVDGYSATYEGSAVAYEYPSE